jgi:hypothetical protein
VRTQAHANRKKRTKAEQDKEKVLQRDRKTEKQKKKHKKNTVRNHSCLFCGNKQKHSKGMALSCVVLACQK